MFVVSIILAVNPVWAVKILQIFHKPPKKLLKIEKAAYKRQVNKEFNDFEIQVVKDLCTKEFFAYYFLMCPNEHPWVDFKKIFDKEEKVVFITLGCHILGKKDPNQKHDFSNIPVMTVLTTLNRVLLFKVTVNQPKGMIEAVEKLYTFNISDIDNIKYDISIIDLPIAKYQAIPVSLSITLKELVKDSLEPVILTFPSISTVAETFIQKQAANKGDEIIPESVDDNYKPQIIIDKLQELHYNCDINEKELTKYKLLVDKDIYYIYENSIQIRKKEFYKHI
ncbi:MAG: hypothetical protein AB7V50_03230 [Vampirovibrionia bacterium]